MKTVRAIHIHEGDTCVTLTEAADAGDAVRFAAGGVEKTVTAREPVPVWHKMAVKPVAAGGDVYKYGERIGIAAAEIAPGEHVHIHNIRSPGEGGGL